MTTATTQAQGKFVKYWDHETPELLKNGNNEIRIYAQHGKVQVYPVVNSASRGIGKGSTINLDTFSKGELKDFEILLGNMEHQGREGYLEGKKYWENEEATILQTQKNEIRFYTKHGKLQVYPKIETGRGIGRGSTINFEGIDFDMDAVAIFDSINSILKTFLNGPDFDNDSTPPPSNKVVETVQSVPQTTQPKSEKEEKLAKLMAIVGGDANKLEKLLALLDDEPKQELPKQDEPKAELTEREQRDAEIAKSVAESKAKFEAMSDDELLRYGVNHHVGGWVKDNSIKAFKEGGKDLATQYLKKHIGESRHGFGVAGIQGDANSKGVKYECSDGRRFSLNWSKLWDTFHDFNPFALDEEQKPQPTVEEEAPVVSDEDEMMAAEMESEMESENMVKSTNILTPVSNLSDDELVKGFEKHSAIDAKEFNLEYTVELFEEIKKRKIN